MNDGRIEDPTALRSAGRLLLTLTAFAWLAACATRGASAFSPSEVDVTPELQGCGSYSDPSSGRGYNLEVRFVVDTAGAVEPGSITVMPRRQAGRTHSPEMVREAKRDAEQCRFSPALMDGEPVPVQMTKRFYYTERG